jgi:hypothetical protein
MTLRPSFCICIFGIQIVSEKQILYFHAVVFRSDVSKPWGTSPGEALLVFWVAQVVCLRDIYFERNIDAR